MRAFRSIARTLPLARAPRSATFHASSIRRSDEKEVAAPAEEYSIMGDWKFQLPTAVLVAIPLVKTEMLILSEETQLVGCFMMFTAAAYTFGGDLVADMLDERKIALLAEHGALEEAAINSLREVVAAHEKRLTLADDLKILEEVYAETSAAMVTSATFEAQYLQRDKMVAMLDNVAAKTAEGNAKLQASLVAEALASVMKSFPADKKAKDTSLSAAIAAVGAPATKGAAAGAPVDALFASFFAAKSKSTKASSGKPMILGEEKKALLLDQLTATAARDGIDVSKADLEGVIANLKT